MRLWLGFNLLRLALTIMPVSLLKLYLTITVFEYRSLKNKVYSKT